MATFNLGCTLDLKKIATCVRNTEYNKRLFPAVRVRIREPKTTANIFENGKIVCTGATSEEFARFAARKVARIIMKLGFPAQFKEFKILNIVGSCDVKFPIRLEQLRTRHSQFCSYEPELFPGLIYRMLDPKVVLNIFASGKIVLAGAKEKSQIHEVGCTPVRGTNARPPSTTARPATENAQHGERTIIECPELTMPDAAPGFFCL